jgi:hypothetical protein
LSVSVQSFKNIQGGHVVARCRPALSGVSYKASRWSRTASYLFLSVMKPSNTQKLPWRQTMDLSVSVQSQKASKVQPLRGCRFLFLKPQRLKMSWRNSHVRLVFLKIPWAAARCLSFFLWTHFKMSRGLSSLSPKSSSTIPHVRLFLSKFYKFGLTSACRCFTRLQNL